MRFGAKTVGLVVAGAVILGCFGGGTDVFGNLEPTVTGFFPCSAQPGDEVTIVGHNFDSPGAAPAVTFNGTPITTMVSRTATKMVVQVPAGGSNGKVRVSTSAGFDDSFDDFEYGGGVVTEIEPNDDINGADSTQVPKSGKSAGTLSSVADKDHFTFGCLDQPGAFIIKVSPTISPIYINGAPFNPNAAGEVTLTPSAATILVGLTGATGPYTVTIRVAP